MEGVLFVRRRRSKLLHTWQKRYVVLTRDGVLKEYAEASRGSMLPAAGAVAIAGSGMALKQELHIQGADVVALPFPLAGRPHAFRVKRKKAVKVTLAAKNVDMMNQWIDALRAVCSVALDDSPVRVRSPAMWGRVSNNGLERGFADDSERRSSSIELPVMVPRTSEQEFVDVHVHKLEDLAQLLQISQWNSHRLCTRGDWSLEGVPLVRGSMVVAVNGISLQTLNQQEVAAMLRRPSRLPVTLRWLKSPHRRGILKCKLCYGLTTHLKTIAMYRNGLRAWKEQIVEIDGDVLTCQPKADGGKESNRSVIPLVGGCTVKSVHEIVAEQKYCFLVSVKAYSMLFQASSRDELVQWTDAIQRAINIAEGCIPGFDLTLTLDDLQLESSVNMRNRGMLLSAPFSSTARMDHTLGMDDSDSSLNDSDEDESESDVAVITPPFVMEPVRRGSEFPDDQLSGMLEFLQATGRFIEALQLMASESSQRASYWKSIFRWAMDPVEQTDFDAMLHEELNTSDSVQLLKDVPRTSKWLAGSPGAPVLTEQETTARLRSLESVLHAFLVSCESDVRTDARSKSAIDVADGKSFYMQGMNGIAFIILQVVGDDDDIVALELLRGVVVHILPHVFGIRANHSSGDNFDLFTSLVEVGNVLEEVVQMHLPNFHEAMDQTGLPVCLLAYKWFPTLFSDISLMAHRSQLRYDTLLAIWDVCLLMGIEGMFCVALALFSAAEEAVVTLRGKGASTETITATIITVLASIGPQDLTISVCEVIELCSHPVLLKLRNGHRRRLQEHAEAARQPRRGTLPSRQVASPVAASAQSQTSPQPSLEMSPPGTGSATTMTVRDLDSGKLFRISNTGSMLLPVKPSSSRG